MLLMLLLISVDGQMFTALRDFSFYKVYARNSKGEGFFSILLLLFGYKLACFSVDFVEFLGKCI